MSAIPATSELELWGGIECTVNRVGTRFNDQLELSGADRSNSGSERMREITIAQLLGKRVVDSEGQRIGRIHEIRVQRGEESCPVEAYMVGKRALLQRLGTWAVPAHIGGMIESRFAKGFRNQLGSDGPERSRASAHNRSVG